MSIETWKPFDMDMAAGVAALCGIAADKSVSTHMARKVAAALAAFDKEKATAEPKTIADCVHTFLMRMEQLGHRDALDTFTLPLDANGWLAVCDGIAAGWKPDFWRIIRPKAEFPEVIARLTEAINADQFGQLHCNTIRVTSAGPLAGKWKELVVAIRKRLEAAQNVAPKPANWLLKGLNEIRVLGSSEASSALKGLADEGHLLHHLQRAKAERNADGAVWCMFSFLRERPGAAKPGQVGDSEPGFEALNTYLASEDGQFGQRFLALVEQQGETALLLRIVDARAKYDPLIRVCLREIADSANPERLLQSELVLERWRPLKDALDSESTPNRFSELIKHLSKSGDFCQRIIARETGFVVDEVPLYAAVGESENCSSARFGEWCKNGLQDLDQSAWRSQLSGDVRAIRFLLDLRERGLDIALGHGFSDAVEDHAKAVAQGTELPPDDLRARWTDVLSTLKDSTRAVLRSRLLDVVIEMDGNTSPAFFQIYGKELSDPNTVAANPRSVSHVFSPIIRQKNGAGLRWLQEFLGANPEFVENFPNSDSVNDFKTRVRECLAHGVDDEADRVIQEIASAISIHLDETSEDVGVLEKRGEKP